MNTNLRFISLTKLDGKKIKINQDKIISYEESENGTLIIYGLEDSNTSLKEVIVQEEYSIVEAYIEGTLRT